MGVEYIPPEKRKAGFHCPHCHTYAKQDWKSIYTTLGMDRRATIEDWHLSYCHRCEDYAVWVGDELVFPPILTGPTAHEDMPEDVVRDYREARKVVEDSPRAAGALLRLSIQRLMKHLDAEGGSLNSQIGNLVKEGRISSRTQQALDAVRVIGNESVHPGTMDMDDDSETVMTLFNLVNGIVQETIALDKLREEIYDSIPESKKKGIEDRDG